MSIEIEDAITRGSLRTLIAQDLSNPANRAKLRDRLLELQAGLELTLLTVVDTSGCTIMRVTNPEKYGDYLYYQSLYGDEKVIRIKELIEKTFHPELEDLIARGGNPVIASVELFPKEILKEELMNPNPKRHGCPGGFIDERLDRRAEVWSDGKRKETRGMMLTAIGPVEDRAYQLMGAIIAGKLLNNDTQPGLFGFDHQYPVRIFLDDILISATTCEWDSATVGSSLPEKVAESFLQGKGSERVLFVEGADDTLYAYTPIRDSSGRVIGALSAGGRMRQFDSILEDLKEGASSVESKTLGSILIVILAASAIAIVLGFSLAKHFTKPIERLREGSEIVAKGDLNHRFSLKTGDEMEELSEQFNRMVAKLHESRSGLEERIKETAERLAVSDERLRSEREEYTIEKNKLQSMLKEREESHTYTDEEKRLRITRSFKEQNFIEEFKEPDKEIGFANIIGRSSKMQELFELIRKVAPTQSTVLIEGESGTGKELIAKAIHQHSPRRDKSFVAINTAAVSESLLEAELFGYKKGAFTGADKDKRGLFEEASGGTIFFDEVGVMPESFQRKLLRVIEEREMIPVGGTKPVRIDVRMVAATNMDLGKQVKEGRFREDLYFRLNVIKVEVPPLRERKEDIPLIAQNYLKQIPDTSARQISKEAMEVLMNYNWPGNVRELQNVLERAALLTRDKILTAQDLPEELTTKFEDIPFQEAREQFEKAYLTEALRKNKGNVFQTAQNIGIKKTTIYRLMQKYHLPLRS
jgi:transcriptional regulator with PAS, ATPase and Fis domain